MFAERSVTLNRRVAVALVCLVVLIGAVPQPALADETQRTQAGREPESAAPTDLSLIRTLSGVVQAPDGKPMPGVKVVMLGWPSEEFRLDQRSKGEGFMLAELAAAVTDSSGSFVLHLPSKAEIAALASGRTGQVTFDIIATDPVSGAYS